MTGPVPAPGTASGWAGLGGALTVAYFVLLAWTLPDFGVTWDEPEWFEHGDRHLRYFETFDRQSWRLYFCITVNAEHPASTNTANPATDNRTTALHR